MLVGKGGSVKKKKGEEEKEKMEKDKAIRADIEIRQCWCFCEKFRCSRTWLVHTLLNATKANVCASIVPARSFFANARGIKTALRASCGMKARDSNLKALDDGIAEERCKSVL